MSRRSSAPDLCCQSAAIPYRRGAGGMEVLMVTSRKGGRWLFPKGGIGKGLTSAQSAAREAYEEAGVIGDTAPVPLGSYQARKRDMTKAGPVEVYLMRVREELSDWPEKGQRRLRWVDVSEAALLVREPDLAVILQRLSLDDMDD